MEIVDILFAVDGVEGSPTRLEGMEMLLCLSPKPYLCPSPTRLEGMEMYTMRSQVSLEVKVSDPP